MNDTKILGRLVQEPVLSKTAENVSVCFGTLALTRPSNPKTTDFIDFMCFDKLADSLSQYKHKGDEILVEGEMRSYKKDNKNQQGLVALKITYLRNKQATTEGVANDMPETTEAISKKETIADKVVGFFK